MEKQRKGGSSAQDQVVREDVHVAVNRCPFCHDDVGAAEGVVCRDCLARHHPGCWEEGNACSSCGSDHLLRADPRQITDSLVRELLRARGYNETEISPYLDRQPKTKCPGIWIPCGASATVKGAFGSKLFCEEHARSGRTTVLVVALAMLLLFAIGIGFAVVASG